MSEFYEPNLFMSMPEHPNTMGVMLKAHRASGRRAPAECDGEAQGDVMKCERQ